MTAGRALVALGSAELLLLVLLAWSPRAHTFPVPGLAVFGVAFVVYAAAARLCARRRAVPVRAVWGMAIAMRVALVPFAPELSDDVYRYLWDGHVQLSGVNPYVHAPADPAVGELRTEVHARVNNPDVPTIYPPLAQIAFLLLAVAGSSLLATKALWIVADLATAWVLVRIARETGRDEATVLLLYSWAPLLVVEVAWSAHLEPLGLLALSAALWASARADGRPGVTGLEGTDRGRRWQTLSYSAGAALALAALTKFAPAAALPALVRRLGWRPLAAFALVVVALYAPYAPAGAALFTGLRTYGEHWWFMKGPFALLEAATGDPVAARRLAALGVGAVVVGTAWLKLDLERALLWTLGTGMLLTPTLHPWYVLWMLPMAALRRSLPWIALTGLAFIGYYGLGEYRLSGEWAQPPAARLALWAPFLVLLVVDGHRARRPAGSDDSGADERG